MRLSLSKHTCVFANDNIYTIYIELWNCDLLKATTDDAPDGDRTGDPSTQSPMRYRLRQPAPPNSDNSSRAEHFKLGGCDFVGFLTAFLNCLISAKKVRAVLKEGILISIFKKGGTCDPGNYI